jgi:hypothetical protein
MSYRTHRAAIGSLELGDASGIGRRRAPHGIWQFVHTSLAFTPLRPRQFQ